MKNLLLRSIVAVVLLAGCSDGEKVDSLFLESEEELPKPPPEIIEVPVSLSLSTTSPDANSNVGYEVVVEGTCNVPGSVVQVSGDSTGLSVCQLDYTWKSTLDLSGLPIGNVNLDFVLTQGDISSESVSLTLNKPSDACDDPLKRAATFATAVSPYEICTITQLENMATLISGGNVTADFILRNSLDFKGGSWSRISARFMGTFEGSNLSISNMNINLPSSDEVGMFTRGGQATFQNLTFNNVSVKGRNQVGIIFGETNGAGNTVTFNNVDVVNSSIDANNDVGGLLGRLNDNTNLVVNDVNVGISLSAVNSVGGVLGYARTTGVSANIDYAVVTGEVAGNQYIGGIVGNYEPSNLILDHSSYTGDVNGSTNRIGGLVGRMNGGTVENSFVVGDVTSIYDGGNEAYIGGLIGYADTTTDINTCYHNGLVSGLAAYIGGLVGRHLNGIIYDSYSIGDGGIVADGDTRSVNYIGGLVGYSTGTVDVQRSYSSKDITVTGTMSSSNMGGLFGAVRAINLVDSYNTGVIDISTGDTLTTGGNAFGGMIGLLVPNATNPTVTISNSYNTGNITVLSATNDVRTGGLIGYLSFANGGYQSVTIGDSYFTGNINTTNRYTGGLIGHSRMHRNGDDLTMTDVTFTGNITVSQYGSLPNELYLGGIAGYFEQDTNNPSTGDFTLTNATATGDFIINGVGGNYVGGIAGYATFRRDTVSTMTNLTYSGGAFSTPKGNSGALFGRILATNDASLTINTMSATVPSFTTGDTTGYSGGAIGRISAANNSVIDIDDVTVNIAGALNFQGQRVGGLIGDLYASNSGTIDLSNFTLANATTLTNSTTSEYTAGAVGRIESRDSSTTTIDNVNHSLTAITSGGRSVGGFAGYASGNGTGAQVFSNLNNAATVTSTATNSYIGGIIGQMRDYIEIQDCSNTGDISIGGGGYAGGIAGGSDRGNRRISDCTSTGDITAPGNYVGGIVGRMYGIIENSYALGDVNGNNDYIGGLVGEMRSTSISNSFATGDVTGARYVGGLAGYIRNPVTVTDSFSAGNVEGTRDTGGFMGYMRGSAGNVDSIYTLGTVTRTSGTQNSFGEICGNCDSDGDVTNSYFNSDTVMILGGVGSPEVQGNTGRGAITADLQNPAFYPGSWDFVGTNNDSWRMPVGFTLKGEVTPYAYPILYWVEN